MAITSTPFDKFLKGQADGTHFVDLNTDALKLALHTASWTPDLAANEFFTDASNEIAGGSGYSAGGQALATKVVALDASHFAALTADPAIWTGLTQTWRYGTLRKDTGSDATSPLILLLDFGSNQTGPGGAIDTEIDWPNAASGGILKFARGA